MSFNDLFDNGQHKKNIGHFASIVTMACSDGNISEKEEILLKRFARKLDIDETEYAEILKIPTNFPINPPNNKQKRLERLFDLFRIVYADHELDEHEEKLMNRYAIGLGYHSTEAKRVIKKSKEIFGGKIKFEDYEYLISK